MLPRIHVITDVRPDGPSPADRDQLERLAAVAAAGADAVQLRAKHLTDRELVAWTRAAVAVLRPLGCRVVVNDRVDVALAADADGVHLGLDDLPVRDARALVPAGFLVGATCRGTDHARRARADGADYAGVGPVFATTTKDGLPEPLGLDVLRRTATVLPCVAVGGVAAERVPAVMAAGAHGVAVVAAVWRAADPPSAAREIRELVHAA